MNTYIVTVKLPKNPDHDPRNKKTGTCQFSLQCTDVTGEHHSFLEMSDSAETLHKHWAEQGVHVTRIEMVAVSPMPL